MAADDRVVAALAPRRVEPRREARGRLAGLALVAERHGAIGMQHAKPRHRVGDHAQAIPALEGIVPARGFVAVHALEEPEIVLGAQGRLHLAREGLRVADGPLGNEPRVHEHEAALDMQEGTMPDPMRELVEVGGGEHFLERVALAGFFRAFGHAHQVEVVVAEDGDRAIAEGLHESQARERFGTPVDEVAHEP